MDVLEDSELVDFYTPNGRFTGFTIPYKHNGEDMNYEPDFVARLRNGTTLVIEIKGGGGRIHDPDAVPAKKAASEKWCAAVSNMGTYGSWRYVFCDAKDEADLKRILRSKLAEHGGGSADVPYTVVPAASGRPGVDCVPVVSLRTVAAGKRGSSDDDLFGASMGFELATWENHPPFDKEMFVAKVFGDAMHPTIPAGSYGLFRRVQKDFVPNAKVVLVRDGAIHDPHAGGAWTVRRCIYVGPPDHGKGQMQHIFELWADDDGNNPAFIIHVPSPDDLDVRAEFVCSIPPVVPG